MMRTFPAAVSLLIVIAASANAQNSAAPSAPRWNPAAPENRQLLATFNYATVESVLAEIGARAERRGPADRPALAVTFRTAAVARSCSVAASGRARSARRSASRRFGRGPPTCRPIAWLQRSRASTSATPSRGPISPQDGRPALQRYLTADYGFVRGNLAVNLLVFASQADRFVLEVLRPAPTSAPARR